MEWITQCLKTASYQCIHSLSHLRMSDTYEPGGAKSYNYYICKGGNGGSMIKMPGPVTCWRCGEQDRWLNDVQNLPIKKLDNKIPQITIMEFVISRRSGERESRLFQSVGLSLPREISGEQNLNDSTQVAPTWSAPWNHLGSFILAPRSTPGPADLTSRVG